VAKVGGAKKHFISSSQPLSHSHSRSPTNKLIVRQELLWWCQQRCYFQQSFCCRQKLSAYKYL